MSDTGCATTVSIQNSSEGTVDQATTSIRASRGAGRALAVPEEAVEEAAGAAAESTAGGAEEV